METFDAAVHAALDAPVLPAGTRVLRREGWYQLVNPALREASCNEVMLSRVPEDEIPRRVEEAFAEYAAHELPFKWAVGPMSSGPGLEARIAPRAREQWEFAGMAIASGSPIPASDPAVTVEPVQARNFAEFLEVNLRGWALGPFRAQTEAKLRRMSGHPRYRCFLARHGGRPAATAATLLKDGHGCLIGGVVLPEFRGAGAYRALVRARLEDLRRDGTPFAVTQARAATSAPILTRLGFETLYQARIYRFGPQ